MLNHKSILLTGGTGSFGQEFTKIVLQLYPAVKEIVIFSRDRSKQEKMAARFCGAPVRYIAGDMDNITDINNACQGIDLIIHTAAMRIVPEAEADPDRCIRTNILGARNLINAAVKHHVRQILALSTDMASLVNNVYGATKMLSDKLFIAAHKEHPELLTTIIRYGNIFGSTGTVIPFFMRKAKEDGILPVTDPHMTRFMSTTSECVHIALKVLSQGLGGEIIAPKIKSYNILTIAKAVDEKAEIKVVGLRPGEKLFEEMITRYDSFNTIEAEECFIIIPPYADKTAYCRHYNATPVTAGFEFNSENNPDKISIEEMKKMIASLSQSL